MAKRFVLDIQDKNGITIDSGRYELSSLGSAAWVGHFLQAEDGCTVTITDQGETPHKKYRIDENGRPVPT